MLDDEIAAFAARTQGHLESVLPLLDHLSVTHAETTPEELVAQVDLAIDRLFRARRAFFAGHRWLHESPSTVAGFLIRHLGDLRFDPTSRTWTWRGPPATHNITVVPAPPAPRG